MALKTHLVPVVLNDVTVASGELGLAGFPEAPPGSRQADGMATTQSPPYSWPTRVFFLRRNRPGVIYT